MTVNLTALTGDCLSAGLSLSLRCPIAMQARLLQLARNTREEASHQKGKIITGRADYPLIKTIRMEG